MKMMLVFALNVAKICRPNILVFGRDGSLVSRVISFPIVSKDWHFYLFRRVCPSFTKITTYLLVYLYFLTTVLIFRIDSLQPA